MPFRWRTQCHGLQVIVVERGRPDFVLLLCLSRVPTLPLIVFADGVLLMIVEWARHLATLSSTRSTLQSVPGRLLIHLSSLTLVCRLLRLSRRPIIWDILRIAILLLNHFNQIPIRDRLPTNLFLLRLLYLNRAGTPTVDSIRRYMQRIEILIGWPVMMAQGRHLDHHFIVYHAFAINVDCHGPATVVRRAHPSLVVVVVMPFLHSFDEGGLPHRRRHDRLLVTQERLAQHTCAHILVDADPVDALAALSGWQAGTEIQVELEGVANLLVQFVVRVHVVAVALFDVVAI